MNAPAAAGGGAFSRTPWLILVGLALLWIAAQLHRGQELGWDEVEFFRATRWTGEGRVPFRDFWEHHTPLQWIAFAPVARLFANGPGADSVVVMRWAQALLWVGILVLVMRLARGGARWWALGFLLTSPLFVRSAIEYRVDVLANFAYLAALVLALRQRWIAFGALMSLAVLSNMRMVILVIVTAAILAMWDEAESRWRRNRRAPWMLAGVAGVGVPFVVWLFATGAWPAFVDGVFEYNALSSRTLDVDTWYQFAAPLWQGDLAAIVLWAAAIAGAVLALRNVRRPALPQILALLFLASLAMVAAMEVQYEYHFQGTYLLLVPLAAFAFERVVRWRWIAFAVAAVALVLAVLPSISSSFGAAMRYQDFVMKEVDRRTSPDQRVFDGTGYALRREPVHKYWFLATGVRFLAAQRLIAGYDIAANPPAAIIYNLRMQRWFEIFPKTATYAVSHYVPLTRDLWIPGMTATVPAERSVTWIAPADGRYTLWASEALLRHPWLTRPLVFAALQGERATRYAIPLQRLPRAEAVTWSVDGVAVAGLTARLRKDARVSVASSGPLPVGVLLVPADVRTLCVAPAEPFQF